MIVLKYQCSLSSIFMKGMRAELGTQIKIIERMDDSESGLQRLMGVEHGLNRKYVCACVHACDIGLCYQIANPT